MAECRMATCDFKKKKMPDVDLAIRHPAFFLVDVQQRLNCALSVVSLSLDFFRRRGLHGMSMSDQLIHSTDLAVDLVQKNLETEGLQPSRF